MNQYKIIGGDKKEYGPVSVAEVGEWIQQGRANGDTRVQAKGDSEWIPIRDVPELEPYLGTGSPQLAAGDEPLPPTLDAVPTADQIMAELEGRPHTFSVRDCMRDGWQLFRANLGLFLLSNICFMGVNMVAGMIPLGGLIVTGPLMGGYYMIFIRRARGETASLGDLFKGFKSFLNLFLIYLLIGLIMVPACIPLFLVALIDTIVIVVQVASRPEISEWIVTGIIIVVITLIAYIPVFTVWAMISFAFPLTIDRGLSSIDAITVAWRVTKNCWGKCFWLFSLPCLLLAVLPWMPGTIGIILGVIYQSGPVIVGSVIVLILGILIPLLMYWPFAAASDAAAYEQLFGNGKKQI